MDLREILHTPDLLSFAHFGFAVLPITRSPDHRITGSPDSSPGGNL
jgi:hypothetical protein